MAGYCALCEKDPEVCRCHGDPDEWEGVDPHMQSEPCICGTAVLKPGPQATNWAEDYRLSRHWLKECLKVWDAIPVEFRGDRGAINRETGEVLTLVEKVEAMVREIERLRKELET